MYEKLRFSMNGFMYVLMWNMFNFNVTCGLCPPAVFNGGYIHPNCSRIMFCNVYCFPGFDKTDNLLFCVKGGYWLPNPSSVCIKSVPCPAIFNDGYIPSSCSRLSGNSCTFQCNPAFVKQGNQLTCGKDGMWIQDTNSICINSNTCPHGFNRGYIEPFCTMRPVRSCTFYCNPEFVKKGYWLTCGNNGTWIPYTNSDCLNSVEQTTSNNQPIGEGYIGIIVIVTLPSLSILIVFIVVWREKRSSVRKSQRVPGHAGDTCLRPIESRDQNVTTLRQQPDADGINSVSSFESPSYNGIYDHSFEQRIPTISSRLNYPAPPPSYSETQIATNEAPPTYMEVVRDPTRFNLYI